MTCPGCAREIRLTDAERASGRGYCLLCDARFDVTVEKAGALMRGAEVTVARMPSLPPRVSVAASDARRFVALIHNHDSLWLAGFLGLPLLAFGLFSMAFFFLFVAFGLIVGWSALPTRVGVEDDALVVGRRRVERARIERLFVEGNAALVARLTDGSTMQITRQVLPASTLDWLRVRLDERLRRS
jgi:hypothetical protein